MNSSIWLLHSSVPCHLIESLLMQFSTIRSSEKKKYKRTGNGSLYMSVEREGNGRQRRWPRTSYSSKLEFSKYSKHSQIPWEICEYEFFSEKEAVELNNVVHTSHEKLLKSNIILKWTNTDKGREMRKHWCTHVAERKWMKILALSENARSASLFTDTSRSSP